VTNGEPPSWILRSDRLIGQAVGIVVLVFFIAILIVFVLVLVFVFVRILKIKVGLDQHFQKLNKSLCESFEPHGQVVELVHTAPGIISVDAVVVTVTGLADHHVSVGPPEFLVAAIGDGGNADFSVDRQHISGVRKQFSIAHAAFIVRAIVAAKSRFELRGVFREELQPLPWQWCATDFFKFPTDGWQHENTRQAGEVDRNSL